MATTEYRFHSGARMALNVAAVLCMITIIGLPIGAWILWRVSAGKVTLDDNGLSASALGSLRVEFADVARFGVVRVPIIARGIGGMLARKKVGGDNATNICFQTRAGKTKKFIVSQYDNWEEIISLVGTRLQKQPEELKIGLWGPVWPKLAA